MPSISFEGGLDVNGTVSQLLYVERAPARALESQRAELAKVNKVLDGFEGKVREFRAAAVKLRGATAFAERSVDSSDPNAVRASADPATQTGSYRIRTTQLASTHSVGSVGVASLDTQLTHGSFDITAGGNSFTIDVQSGSDTLEGLRDAINSSGAPVQAIVLYDGSNYRLSMTSATSGASAAMTLDNFSAPALQTELSFAETSAAVDAAFTFNGISVTRPTNVVTDLVPGLNLTLLEDDGNEVVVDVAADADANVESASDFVAAYNSLVQQARTQPATTATLTSVRYMQQTLRQQLSRSVTGLPGGVSNLRQLGVEFQNDGTMTFNETSFRAAIANGTASNVFVESGRTTAPSLRYLNGGLSAEAGMYPVFVTQAAEQARVTGSEVFQPGGLAADELLTFTQGDETKQVQLTAGQSISAVISTLNAGLSGSGIKLLASNDGSDRLRLTSTVYGSNASVDVVSDVDAANSTGIGTTGLTDVGVDVVGTIGGLAAAGSGRGLVGTEGAAKGLGVEVLATPGDIAPGGSTLGDVTYSVGVAERVYRTLNSELSGSRGSLAAERNGLKARDKVLAQRIDSIDDRLAARQVLLSRQLTQADAALRRMQTLTQSISAQLGNLQRY